MKWPTPIRAWLHEPADRAFNLAAWSASVVCSVLLFTVIMLAIVAPSLRAARAERIVNEAVAEAHP